MPGPGAIIHDGLKGGGRPRITPIRMTADGERKERVEAVQRHAATSAFGRPLIQNNLRALVVEAIVDLALPEGWRWCSADWAAWDFEHADGTYLEVKQSAARQTWAAPRNPSPPRFDIAHRKGRWDGAAWIAEPGRYAHIYVFGHHPISDDTADHRDPAQWRFYVVAAGDLPAAQSVSLRSLQALVQPCRFEGLAERAEALRRSLVS
jgi:hypothetical protein